MPPTPQGAPRPFELIALADAHDRVTLYLNSKGKDAAAAAWLAGDEFQALLASVLRSSYDEVLCVLMMLTYIALWHFVLILAVVKTALPRGALSQELCKHL